MKIYVILFGMLLSIVAFGCTIEQNVDAGTNNTDGTQDARPLVLITDSEQQGSTVLVDQVVAPEDGWIVIHRSTDGEIGEAIGYAKVRSGVNNNIDIMINDTGTGDVVAVLHSDRGSIDIFDPDTDLPVDYQGNMIYMDFNIVDEDDDSTGSSGDGDQDNATGTNATRDGAGDSGDEDTALVSVSDQAYENGRVIVERVVSPADGWIVIHESVNDMPGDILGYSPVYEGENMRVGVSVDIDSDAELIAMLHTDTGRLQIFEFPGVDAPVQVNGSTVMDEMYVSVLDSGGEDELVEIDIEDFAFNPEDITISAGTSVRWTNQDSARHTATGADFDSGILDQGESYTYTFDDPGVYNYICNLHPNMRGRIIVE